MNNIFRLIWSTSRQAWVVASEKVTGKGGIPARTVGALSVAALLACGSAAHALPTGNSLVAGQATVSTPTAGQMQINQTSNRAIINWQSFGIASGEAVNISQPTSQSALLNRVIGNSGSEIFGKLTANGQVFLVNPNGVLFGRGAEVNVGGLVASSLNITDDNFMNNNLKFFKDGTAGSVSNQGSISAGFAALLGPSVNNSGSIVTYKGSTVLGAADAVTLNFDPQGLIALKLDQGAYNAQVANSGIIEADGGRVLLTAKSADSILKSMVNNSGIIRARSVDTSNGQILLLGDMDNGTVSVGGTLDATGGFVETSAANFTIQKGANVIIGKGGKWLIDPTDLTIDAALAGTIATALSANGSSVEELATNSITVASPVSWTSTGTLTLNAGTNIAINADISATNGTLKLYYGQSTTTGNGYGYSLSGAKVTLGAGDHFYTKQGSTDAETGWKVITSLGVAGSSTGTDLQGMGGNLSGMYVLGADINASGTSGWNIVDGFNPIGTSANNFTGSFDGLGHSISGLTINRHTTDDVGLFGFTGIGSTIRNVGLVGGSVIGGRTVGGLVGYNGGSISSSYATGSVSGISDTVGGLVGENRGSISSSYATGSVIGIDYVGGLVGYNGGGTISTSYATGSVTGSNNVGGLVGLNNDGSISSSYATGSVLGTVDVGGLVGGNGGGSISSSYFDTTTTTKDATAGCGNTPSCSGVTGLTTAQLAAALPTGFDAAVWGNGDNHTTPYLLSHAAFGTTSGSVILGSDSAVTPTYYGVILNTTQLQNITTNLSGMYVLGSNIDASGTSGWNSGDGFNPIGNNTTKFTGSFDGLGHSISGLYIHRSSTNDVGLFGVTGNGSTIRNVGLVGGSVTGLNYVGGLVGFIDGSTISSSYATGSVSGALYVGGLVGWNYSGGISSSYATGSVSGAVYVGGLVGQNQGSISSSYATGTVTGNNKVGGLVGWNLSASISNSYATGTVTGATSVGGLVGLNNGGSTISTSYFDTTTTGKDATAGCGDTPSCAGVTGLTTAGMQSYSTFSAWGSDISNVGGSSAIWRIYNGYTYPLLRAFLTPLTVTANAATDTYNGTTSFTGSGVSYSAAYDAGKIFGSLTYTAGSRNAGSTTITPGGRFSNQQGYDISFANGMLTVDKATLTLTAATDSRTYDGTTNSSGVVTYSGLQTGDSLTGLTQSFASKNVLGAGLSTLNANYVINDGNSGNNYTVTSNSASGTIIPAALAITANNAGKTYNGSAYTGGNGVSYSGFAGGEDATVLSGSLTYSGTSQGAVNAGSYVITPGGLSSGNYTISYNNGSLTISPAALTLMTVTANNASKTYGSLLTFNGSEFTANGLQNGETIGSVTLTSVGAPATASVGNYAITASNASGGSFNPANYTISYVNGVLTVTPAPLTVTANNASKVYGQTTTFNGSEFTSSGLQNNETIGSVSLASAGAAGTANVSGSPYSITASNATGGSFNAGNYTITYNNGSLTVSPAALVITANTAGKTYGDTVAFVGSEFSSSGLKNSETIGSVSLTSAGAPTSAEAGSYTIIPNNAVGGSFSPANYSISYINGVLNVNPAVVPPQTHTGLIIPAAGKNVPDMNDARLLLQFLLGQKTPTAAQLLAADVGPLGVNGQPQGNGVLDFGDLVTLLRRINGAIIW